MGALEDVKEGKFQNNEYDVDDETGEKAVENIPASSVGLKERLKCSSLDDLKVCPNQPVSNCS
jgi:hypothetical protein